MKRVAEGIFLLGIALLVNACSPTVKIQTPDKPITINLNVKVEQEVRVKVEKDVEDLIKKDKNIF